MLLAFGALIAAGIPVLLAATSVTVTIGLIAPLSHLVHAEGTVSSMIVLIGMAVGVDYSLFYLKREREERAAGRSTLDAVEIAAQTSGHSILVSGAAVIASMAGLFVIGDATFNSLATGAIVVVAVAVLGSITVLPALLVKLGRWVDRPRVPAALAAQPPDRPRRHQPAAAGAGHPPSRCRAAALGRRGRAAGGAGAGHEDPPGQPPDPARRHPRGADLHAADRGVPGRGRHRAGGRRGAAGDQAAVAAALAALDEQAVGTDDFVASGREPVRVSDDGRTSVLELAIPFEESDPRVDDAVRTLRNDLVPATLGTLDG